MGTPFKILGESRSHAEPKSESPEPLSETPVLHDPVGQKFYIPFSDSEAVLAYTHVNDILDVHTTVVPEKYRGQGLAEKLAIAAFEYARANGLKIIPTCPYIATTFLKKHPEYQNLVTEY